MRVNFFVLFPLAQMPDLPISYISAFRAPATPGFDNELSRDFPNITNVDVSASVAQVQQVLDQVIRAVEFLFGFTLIAGLVVLFAAVSATRESRAREFAIMRAMGAGSRLLGQVQRAELLGVGALAGCLASVAAMAVGWALAKYAFEFDWNPSPWVPLAGTAGRRAAGAGRRLVGPARRAAPAGGGDAAPRCGVAASAAAAAAAAAAGYAVRNTATAPTSDCDCCCRLAAAAALSSTSAAFCCVAWSIWLSA